MKDPASVLLLVGAVERQRSAFIKYVVESSQAEVRDDLDRRVLGFYEDWYRASVLHARQLEEVLAGEDVMVETKSYPIDYSQFNYLSPAYLLKNVVQRMAVHLNSLAETARRLEGWPLASTLLQGIVSSEDRYLEEAKKLESDRPQETPKPPRIKGTSAARW